jgi:hypothetical protein
VQQDEDTARSARLLAYGELLGWSDEVRALPAGLPELAGTPYHLKGVDVGPERGEERWRSWVLEHSTPWLRALFERQLLHAYPQCRQLRQDRELHATPPSPPDSADLAALLERAYQAAHPFQLRAPLPPTEEDVRTFDAILRDIVRLRGHVAGAPRYRDASLQTLREEVATAIIAVTHAPYDIRWVGIEGGQQQRRQLRERLDQLLDEWGGRLFAQYRGAILGEGAVRNFKPFTVRGIDSWTGERTLVRGRIEEGREAWEKAVYTFGLDDLEEWLRQLRQTPRPADDVTLASESESSPEVPGPPPPVEPPVEIGAIGAAENEPLNVDPPPTEPAKAPPKPARGHRRRLEDTPEAVQGVKDVDADRHAQRGLSIRDACTNLLVSEDTYYRTKRRLIDAGRYPFPEA